VRAAGTAAICATVLQYGVNRLLAPVSVSLLLLLLLLLEILRRRVVEIRCGGGEDDGEEAKRVRLV
jgi:hypothetical protein